ncbi:MAG: MarR family transcriptional regulator [Alphaproteobacteria bacterium]|nr:MarR family transcriptional regulator [Alphaproteobacteria bacterium]
MSAQEKSIGAPMPAFAGAPGACLCARVRAAARRLTVHYDAHLAPHGLSLAQFGLLAAIAGAGQTPMTQLAATLSLDPSTLSRTLLPLQKAGLVESVADPANRRVRLARLTASGREKAKAAGRAWAAAQKSATEIVDPALVDALSAQTRAL